MFTIIILILLVDTVMLGIFAAQCADYQTEIMVYLVPMYGLLVLGYAALYRIYLKMQGGKREKLADKVQRLRDENIKLKESLGESGASDNSEN